MKFKKHLSVLIAVAMMIGCFPGFVIANETDETQIPVEQTAEAVEEEPAEVEEEQSEETVDEGEEDSVEETEELIEDSDVYSVDPAYAVDDVVHITTWDELNSNLSNPRDGKIYQLDNDISAPSYATRIDILSQYGDVNITLDMRGKTIDMSNASSQNSSLFFIYDDVRMTIANGTITGGHGSDYGAIKNEGELYLNSVTITGNNARYGAVYSNGSLYLNDVSVTDNTSTSDDIAYRGSGIHCEGFIDVAGRIFIEENYRVISSVKYSDNLYLGTASSYITFGNPLESIDSESVIYVDKAVLPGAITSGWDTSYNFDIFHFDNDIMELELHNNGSTTEVYGTFTFLTRSWDSVQGVVDAPLTLYTESVQIGIPAGTTELSGYYFINQDQRISDRLYVKAGRTSVIILADGVTLNCLNGIGVPSNSTLYIYTKSDDSGTLIAGAPANCAGIGGSVGSDGGYIYIYGGTIDAQGNNGAGIGGCNNFGFVSIKVYGGNVRATSNNSYNLGGSTMGSIYLYGGCITLPPSTSSLSQHTSSTIDMPDMCVSNSEGFYFTNANRAVLWSDSETSKIQTLIITPCPHTSGTCSTRQGDLDHHNFVCDYCGHQETQLHTYENGACACGATTGTAAPQFVGHSMQIAGEISLQFFYTLPAGATDSYVTFEGNHIDSSIAHRPTDSDKPGYTCNMVHLNVSSIQIAERYTPTLHYMFNGEPQELTGAPYCVMDYINWGVADGNTVVSPEEKTMLNRLADYGYYSQIYLSAQNGWIYGVDYASVNLGGRRPPEQAINDIKTYTERYAFNIIRLDNTVFETVTFSMRFGDRLSLRVIFDPREGAAVDTSKFAVYSPDGCDYRWTATPLSDGRYAVTITGISSRDAADTIYISYDGIAYNYVGVSPLSYVYAMLCQTGHEDGKNLVCALVNYARACGLIIQTENN